MLSRREVLSSLKAMTLFMASDDLDITSPKELVFRVLRTLQSTVFKTASASIDALSEEGDRPVMARVGEQRALVHSVTVEQLETRELNLEDDVVMSLKVDVSVAEW